ncbi:hypothetical protein QJS10_CPA07g00774 [Acorus calamus]|uniref:Uncharacterized protein n=1 Tax=Acorus calamus TaxID=4465 RepID=A0AAV9EF10_ACOCL|nr:hypothetical protein QJS10_CPA07g00774 [Acorus calamus]
MQHLITTTTVASIEGPPKKIREVQNGGNIVREAEIGVHRGRMDGRRAYEGASSLPPTSTLLTQAPTAVTSSPPSTVLESNSQVLRWYFRKDSMIFERFKHSHILLNHLPLDLRLALSFFDWTGSLPGFRHDHDSHSTLLSLLVRHRLFAAARRIRISMFRSCDAGDVVGALEGEGKGLGLGEVGDGDAIADGEMSWVSSVCFENGLELK